MPSVRPEEPATGSTPEALAARITRLTALVAARGDDTSRQLRAHLDLLSSALRSGGDPSEPHVSPAEAGEVVLSIPPKLDLIEALLAGAPLGDGGGRWRPRLEAAPGEPVDPTQSLPSPSSASSQDAEAAAEVAAGGAGEEAAANGEPTQDVGREADEGGVEVHEAQVPSAREAVEGGATDTLSSDVEPGLEAALPPATIEEGLRSAASEAEALPRAEPEAAPVEARPGAKDETALEAADGASDAAPPSAADRSETAPVLAASLESTQPDAGPSSAEDGDLESLLVRIDEATAVAAPPEGESPWGQTDAGPGEPGALGPTAEGVLRALETPPDESLVVGTQDVLAEASDEGWSAVALPPEVDLEATRAAARSLLQSLGASPGEPIGDGAAPDDLEPLERLARDPVSSRRPQPKAVAALPRHLAYRAMAAPLRLDADGSLVCLVEQEYEPERIQALARTLGRRVTALEVDHREVVAALEQAYVAVGGADQDALLIALSEDRPARGGLVGRVASWIRKP